MNTYNRYRFLPEIISYAVMQLCSYAVM